MGRFNDPVPIIRFAVGTIPSCSMDTMVLPWKAPDLRCSTLCRDWSPATGFGETALTRQR